MLSSIIPCYGVTKWNILRKIVRHIIVCKDTEFTTLFVAHTYGDVNLRKYWYISKFCLLTRFGELYIHNSEFINKDVRYPWKWRIPATTYMYTTIICYPFPGGEQKKFRGWDWYLVYSFKNISQGHSLEVRVSCEATNKPTRAQPLICISLLSLWKRK